MKIVDERKPVEEKGKHKVGGFYWDTDALWLCAEIGTEYGFVRVDVCGAVRVDSGRYDSLADMDEHNPRDIPVDVTLTIRNFGQAENG